jgi:tRNA A-37 threonylcarbamoyl transferase component Bud32
MSATAPGGSLPEGFGPYRFEEVLGSGAVSTVYLARHTLLDTLVVIKVGNPDLDPAARERFQVEAKALAGLEHPNIPRLLEGGLLPDGRPYLVSAWVDGTDLERLLHSGTQLRMSDALRIGRALARALSYAHERGILHLDIKPANILIPKKAGGYRFDDAQLLDFSVLGHVNAATGKTTAGFVVGTAYYMSAEQVRASGLTAAADIYSLGVVLYRLLTGRLPFEGTAMELFHSVLSKDPEPLDAAVPPRLAKLVMSSLAKDPEQRPATAAKVESELDQVLGDLEFRDVPLAASAGPPTPAISTGHGAPAPAMAAAPMPYGDGPTVHRRAPVPVEASSARNIRGLAVGIALVLAVVVLVLLARSAPTEVGLIGLGCLLVAAGVAAGMLMHRFLSKQREQATSDVSALLSGARTQKALSLTLSVQVDEVVKKCKLMDEKFLGLTMAVMVNEYESARNFDDRQKALMNAIAILDKLGPKLSPWYVRHDKLIATGVSLVGIISGLATAAQSVVKLLAPRAH